MVFASMRDWIADGTLLPGQHMVPERLAGKLKVSRTPVVNALKRLNQVGLVEWIPNSGAYVKRWSKLELAQTFELREVLEGLAARHAALTLSDEEIEGLDQLFAEFRDETDPTSRLVVRAYLAKDRIFHRRIIEAAGSPALRRTIELIHVTTTSFAAGLIRTVASSLSEHGEIIGAFRARDPEEAERYMRRHLRRSVDALYDEVRLDSEQDDRANAMYLFT